jgi:hypothetical protein
VAEKELLTMSTLPKYYFRDIPAHLMEEIITGMIEGKMEPTPELEREAEAFLAESR